MNIVTNPNGNESYMKGIFNKFLILHNYNELEDTTEFTDFLKGYFLPYENKITKETNKVWRNTFGEVTFPCNIFTFKMADFVSTPIVTLDENAEIKMLQPHLIIMLN